MSTSEKMAKLQQMSQQFLQSAMNHVHNYKDKKCKNCGTDLFMDVIKIRVIPKMLVGAPTDIVVRMPQTVCIKCGMPFTDTTPSEVNLETEGRADG